MSTTLAPAPGPPPAPPPAPAVGRVRARRARTPRLLLLAALLVALVLAVPLAFLLIEAANDGWTTLHPLLFRHLTVSLLWNTVSLTVVVTLLCAVIGTLAAWCVERTDLPGRRVWAVLVVVPIGIPDFVVSFGWKSLFTSLGGIGGAALVMTLAVYPLVFLPVAASLRNADPALEEVARSLGLGRLQTFWRVTSVRRAAPSSGAAYSWRWSCSPSTGRSRSSAFRPSPPRSTPSSSTASTRRRPARYRSYWSGLSLLVLGVEGLSRGRGRESRTGPLAARPPHRHRLGRARWPVLGAFVALVGLALGVPAGAIIYWILQSGQSTLPSASIASAAWHTAFYSAMAGLLATVAALPVAILSVRYRGRPTMVLERSTYLVLAMPGLVIALALTYFSERYAAGLLYQSATMLIVCYAIMFFPLALVAVRTSVAQFPPALEEMARALGGRPLAVLWRVTLPLVAPGLAAAFCLVFLEAVTELTATLVLIPTGVQTLATQFWAFQTNLSYGQAAPYAGVMMLVAALPSVVLGRWFDRLPSRRRAAP